MKGLYYRQAEWKWLVVCVYVCVNPISMSE